MTEIKQGKGETKTKQALQDDPLGLVKYTVEAFKNAGSNFMEVFEGLSLKDQEQLLAESLSLGGLKNHDTIIPGLTDQQKTELITLSKRHKRIQNEILTNDRLLNLELLKRLQKEYKRLNFDRWKEEPDKKDQAARFQLFLKNNFEQKDFERATEGMDIATSGHGVLSAEFITAYKWMNLTTQQALQQTGAVLDATGAGWAAKVISDPYNDFLSSAKELFENNGTTPELIGDRFYLKMLDEQLISGNANGHSPLLNFIKWADEQEQERFEIQKKIEKVAGVTSTSQVAVADDIAPTESDEVLSDEVIERQRRFQDQCFLASNFDKIIKESTIREKSYKNFVSVQGEPFIATNNLSFHKGQKAFIDLTSTEMSTLLPKVQLSKVIYGPGGNANEVISIPFIFGTHNDFKDPSMLTMGKRARGDDAGIESFTFSFEGQDYATADKILVCNATYFFKSMSDFIAEFSVQKGNNKFQFSYSDLAAYPAGRRPFTIKADVGWQTPSDLSSIIGESRANKVRKAAASAKLSIFMNVVSFNYEVNEDGSIKVFVEYRGWINDILSGLKFDIFLNPDTSDGYQEHEVKTAEYLLQTLSTAEMINRQAKHVGGLVDDGIDMGLQVSLSDNLLNFTNYLSQTLADTPGTNTNVIDQTKLAQLLNRDTGTTRSFAEVLFGFRKDRSPTNTSGDKEYRQALVESANRIVQKVKQAGQLVNHNGLLDEIFKQGLVYTVNIPESSLAHYQKPEVNRNLSPSLTTTFVKEKTKSFDVIELDPAPQAVIGDDLISATNKAFRNRAKKNKQDSSHFPEAGGANGRFKDGYTIYFVTFGTILNTVMSRVYSGRSKARNSFIEKFKLMVGSASTETGPFTAKDISIADIPVSLDLFTYWYLTEVMERDQTTYSVGPFIQNMLSKLILPSLGADCQDNAEVSDLYTIKGQIYNTMGVVKKTQGKPLKTTPLKKGDRVDSTEISIKTVSASQSLKNMNSYYYIFMNTRTALKGTKEFDRQRDGKEGRPVRILTLGTGFNRGLTRSIKFKGNDIPYFQEAADAALKTKEDGGAVRRMLKFHDADVELFGNTIFYPGMIVYIKPNFPGIRTPFGNSKTSVVTPKIIASTLGIGGYYVITKVRSNIDSSGGFTTTIVANYEAGV